MSSGKARGQQDSLAPALFPFLAVMVCTIGALVFILTIAVTQASQSAKAELLDAHQEAQEAQDYLDLATKELLAVRKDEQEKIGRAIAAVSHLDSHIERLEKELDSLKLEAAAVQEKTTDGALATSQHQELVEQLRTKVEDLELQIAEAIESKKVSRPAFSIIPYVGPNGTARRPIYLECVAEGVLIQPEGILLAIDDLKPPHGPGNPLDACLRTIRSKMQEFDQSSFAATPYPLLLVRPDGIASYALARSALSAWDDQQGYELIDAEMPLSFPSSLPGMRDQLETVLVKARARQTEMMAAMPRRYASSDTWDDTPADLAVQNGDEALGGGTRELGAGERFIPGTVANEWPTIPGVARADSPQGSSTLTSMQDTQIGSRLSSSSGNSNLADSDSASYVEVENGSGQEGRSGGQVKDQAAGGNPLAQSSGAASNAEQSSAIGDPAEAMSAEARAELAKQRPEPGTATSSNTQSGPPSAGQEQGGQEQSSAAAKAQKANSQSIANSLGHGWAIQRKQLSSTPVHRSIEIRVLPDRWQIVDSGNRNRIEHEILLGQGPRVCAQQLSKAVQDRIEQWGIAVNNGYWVPIISLNATADAQWAEEQLKAMLADSGVEIRSGR